MKIINIFLAILSISFNVSTQAEANQGKMIDKVFPMYSLVKGGYELNKKCNHIANQKLEQYERYIGEITNSFIQAGVTLDQISEANKELKKRMESPQFSKCNDETLKLVTSSFNFAERWVSGMKSYDKVRNKVVGTP